MMDTSDLAANRSLFLDVEEDDPSNDTMNASSAAACEYEFTDPEGIKFPLLVIVTPSLCAFGIVGNLLAIVVLSRPRFRSSSTWYLLFLAISDLGVLVTCLLLYTVEVLYDTYRNFTLYRAWYVYAKLVYWLSHVSQVNGVYLTVAATVERWALLGFQRNALYQVTKFQTMAIICSVAALSIALTASKLFELEVIVNDDCANEFGMYRLEQSDLLNDPDYNTVYSLWISSIFFVFLPFCLLLFFNSLIVWKIMRSKSFCYPQPHGTTARLPNASSIAYGPISPRIERRIMRKKAQEMTRVLLVVVGVFLLCNAPSVALSLAEKVDPDWLNDNGAYYALARDMVNLLAVINASANFMVYVLFGREFRIELRAISCFWFRKLFCCVAKKLEEARLRRVSTLKTQPKAIVDTTVLVGSLKPKQMDTVVTRDRVVRCVGQGCSDELADLCPVKGTYACYEYSLVVEKNSEQPQSGVTRSEFHERVRHFVDNGNAVGEENVEFCPVKGTYTCYEFEIDPPACNAASTIK